MGRVCVGGAVWLVALAAVALVAGVAQADVVLVDDFAFGTDSVIRATYGDTSMDYLTLAHTAGRSYYSDILNELGTGGDFEGWSVAWETDMDFLGLAAGVVHGSTDAAAVAKAENLRDLFGNVRTTASHIAARGLLADLAGPSLAYQAAFTIGVAINVNPYESEFRVSGYGPLAVIPNESTYLVRTAAAAIPEPATLSLLGLGLAGLAVARRRRK